MKYYTKPIVDWIIVPGCDIQTADLISTSEDNDLVFDWLTSNQGGTPILIPLKGRAQ